MRSLLLVALLCTSTLAAAAATRRDSPAARFDNDIRAAESQFRPTDRSNRIEPHNTRLRERLFGTGHRLGPRLPRSD